MGDTLRFLLLEDNQSDAELITRELQKANFHFDYKLVENKEKFIEQLIAFEPHIIISDYSLPQYNGIEAIQDLKKVNDKIPIIIVTGTLDEETAAETIKKGAWDYVVKERLFRLPSAVSAALKLKQERDKKAEVETSLSETKSEFETLRNNVPLALYRTAPDGKLLYVNRAYLDIFRYDSVDQALKDNAIDRYVDPVDRERILDHLLRKGELQHYEVELLRTNGTRFWGSFNIRAIFDNKGKHIFQDGILSDITEIKNAHQATIRAKEKAEESDKLKTAFLANMSHEIRTPMNAIIGFTDLIATDELDRNEMLEFISHIQRNGETLLRIIGDIIDVAKIESGVLEVSKVTRDVNHFIKEVFDEFKEKIAGTGKNAVSLILENQHNEQDVQTHSDFVRLKQILNNLTDNALKFSESGEITLGYEISGEELKFFVKDTGIGIPDEMKEIIFERFRQVDDSHTREFGGTGLGLTIAKSFVEKLGGEMWVESEVYKGSSFYFTIPYTIPEERGKDKTRSKTDGHKDWQGKKVLIAEDVDSNYYYLEVILKSLNIKPIRAINGNDAIDFCKNDMDIDLVLMDIQMPEMNGYDATREIKKIRMDLPVIGQTAFALSSDREKVLDAGCDEYLVKPILKSRLVEVLDRFL